MKQMRCRQSQNWNKLAVKVASTFWNYLKFILWLMPLTLVVVTYLSEILYCMKEHLVNAEPTRQLSKFRMKWRDWTKIQSFSVSWFKWIIRQTILSLLNDFTIYLPNDHRQKKSKIFPCFLLQLSLFQEISKFIL